MSKPAVCSFGTIHPSRCECRKAMHADTYLRTKGVIMQASFSSAMLRALALANLEVNRRASKKGR